MRDCLDPCLEQDFPISEFEIICVDDGSTDGSLTILRKYEAKFPNVRVIAFPKNKGVSAARNAGLEQMQGNWCLFLDSDDFLADGCFAKAKFRLSHRAVYHQPFYPGLFRAAIPLSGKDLLRRR